MPATFAHPVFSIPFARLGLPVSALVTGAMAPDLALALPDPRLYVGHSLLGVLYFSGPVGLLAWFVFHTIVRPGLWPLAPRPWQVALRPWTAAVDLRSPRVWGLALLAACTGATTHILVDHATHDYGLLAQRWPEVWATPVVSSPIGGLPIYKLLQYGFGVGGTAVLAAWTYAAYRRGQRQGHRAPWTPADRRRLVRLGAAIALTGLAAALYGALCGLRYEGVWRVKVFAVNAAAAGIVFVLAQAVLLGAWGRWRRPSGSS